MKVIEENEKERSIPNVRLHCDRKGGEREAPSTYIPYLFSRPWRRRKKAARPTKAVNQRWTRRFLLSLSKYWPATRKTQWTKLTVRSSSTGTHVPLRPVVCSASPVGGPESDGRSERSSEGNPPSLPVHCDVPCAGPLEQHDERRSIDTIEWGKFTVTASPMRCAMRWSCWRNDEWWSISSIEWGTSTVVAHLVECFFTAITE